MLASDKLVWRVFFYFEGRKIYFYTSNVSADEVAITLLKRTVSLVKWWIGPFSGELPEILPSHLSAFPSYSGKSFMQ